MSMREDGREGEPAVKSNAGGQEGEPAVKSSAGGREGVPAVKSSADGGEGVPAVKSGADGREGEPAVKSNAGGQDGAAGMVGSGVICPVLDMDLGQIASSGQCFRMEEREPGIFSVIAGDRYIEIEAIGETEEIKKTAVAGAEGGCPEKRDGGRLFKLSCSQEEFKGFWSHYFDLETDYGRIKALIPAEDTYLTQAAEMGWGIRILRQDLWETIVTFILSQQNNIPRIRRCVRLLSERYGKRQVNFRKEAYYGFPGAGELAGAGLEELKGCGLGYRARYIAETARMVAEGHFSLEELGAMGHEDAKKELQRLCGVGVKVAECVCLFALHHIDAFPVDTHIAQALKAHYPDGFPFDRYGRGSGVLQQYIFFYEVNKK